MNDVVVIEAQIMRDWEPRSSPGLGHVAIHSDKSHETHLRLFPGSVSQGERMDLKFTNGVWIYPTWVLVSVQLFIDFVPFGEGRPLIFWSGVTSHPTGIVHFPVMAGMNNPMYRGFHSVTVRAANDRG
jgi:hypothetical protein